ncbi:MAG: acetyltransferase [Anaerolineaceae bacterium]|nr:acetyltransferase [Anaerolineaceae bacterium]
MKNNHFHKIPPKVILWGGTGQAKVVRPIIEYYGSRVVAVFDDTPNLPSPFADVPLFLGWSGFRSWVDQQPKRTEIGFCVAIGNPYGRVRLKFSDQLISDGLVPVTVIHPSAILSDNIEIGVGCQIMAGAVINPEVRIGNQCIINTKASIDHECIISDGCEVAPGATLCGCVQMDINSWVCAGATVLPRIHIGADAIVGAGAVITRNVPAGTTVVGVPAKPIKRKAAKS